MVEKELFRASALSCTAFGLLSVAGLLVSGLAFQNLGAVLFALLSAASSYLAMFAVMLALTNRESLGLANFATIFNPTMTFVACAFWVAGFFQLWG